MYICLYIMYRSVLFHFAQIKAVVFVYVTIYSCGGLEATQTAAVAHIIIYMYIHEECHSIFLSILLHTQIECRMLVV